MMRILIAASLAASLYTSSLLAADMSAPLPPAKAAGVQNAQDFFGISYPILIIAAGIGIAAAIALGNTSPNSVSNSAPISSSGTNAGATV